MPFGFLLPVVYTCKNRIKNHGNSAVFWDVPPVKHPTQKTAIFIVTTVRPSNPAAIL
jgi:hypothetical protein